MVLFLAIFVVFYLKYGYIPLAGSSFVKLSIGAFLIANVSLLTLLAFDAYTYEPSHGLFSKNLRFLLGLVLSLAILAILFYFLPDLRLARSLVVYGLLGSWMLLSLFRFWLHDALIKGVFQRKVLILGRSNSLEKLNLKLKQHDVYTKNWLKILDVIELNFEPLSLESSLSNLKSLLQEADEIVISEDDILRSDIQLLSLLCDARLSGVSVVNPILFFEKELGIVESDLILDFPLDLFSGFKRTLFSKITARWVDMFLAFALLLFAWPIILIAIVAIWVEDGIKAPFLYTQIRVGHKGKTFKLFKFRSMGLDSEIAGVQWAQKNDPRVTKVGRIIRRYRIDELPQLFNVMKGEMSFVGPRPERPEFVSMLKDRIPFYESRHWVKPGLTGWAQLNYPYGSTIDDAVRKLDFDLYYLKNQGFMLDFLIVLRTFEVVFLGRGAR